MKRLPMLPALLLLTLGLAPQPATADIEAHGGPLLKPSAPPLDTAIAANGSRTFLLLEGGKVQIYDHAGNLRDSLDVDPATDHISTDGGGSRIVVSSNKKSIAQQIDISFRFPFDYTDSPFLGKGEAPVVLAVFSDFQ